MSHVSIGSAIETILTGVTSLNAVYSGVPDTLDKYPCACVLDMGWENKQHDTGGNIRTHRFRVIVFSLNSDKAAAEALIRDLSDDVIAAIEGNVTLTGTCDFATATSGVRQFGEREVPVTFMEITVLANKRYLR
jgi:hypothetical protein